MSEWKEKRLNKIAEIRVSNVDKKIHQNKSLVKLCNYMDVYSNAFITNKISFQIGSADSNEISRFGLNVNDVIITKDSETPDDIAISSVVKEEIDSLVCGYHLAILRPFAIELDGTFLMYKIRLPEIKNYFFRVANGSTRYGLVIGDIENANIKYPTSLSEQRKIARILSTVDAVIEKTEAAIAKYKAIKAGMMRDLFTRGIDLTTGKLRPRYEDAPRLYKESELGWVPKVWEVRNFGEVTDKISDRDHYTPKYFDTGVPIISPKDFGEDELIFFDDCRYVSIEEHNHNMSKTDLREGDLVFTRIGALLGKVCLVEEWMPSFSILHSACMIRTEKAKLNSRYLFNFIKTSFFQDQILAEIQSIGVPDLGLEKIKAFKIVLPKSLIEQDRISKEFAKFDKAYFFEKLALKKAKQLKQALMSDLLTGKVRVKHEEEKAEVMKWQK